MSAARLGFEFANVEPSANWRPQHRRMRTRKDVSHTIRDGLRSMIRSVARRADFDVPNLTELADLHQALDDALVVAVANLREQGHSWDVIGAALGISRQAAFARYADRIRPGAR